MIVLCNIYKSVDDLLPHFYEHYHSLGIDRFAFGVHEGDANPVWERILSHNKLGLKVSLFKSYSGPIDGREEGRSLDTLRKQIPGGEWYIPADLDEFHTVLGFSSFADLRSACQAEGATHVRSRLCDRIASDGSIPATIDPNTPIFRQFPRQCDITATVLNACTDKICLAEKVVQLNDGHHHPLGDHKSFSVLGVTYHFKWFGDLRKKELEKFESYRQKKLDYHKENESLLAHLANRSRNGRLI